jgi:hypothetical protein
MYARNHSCTLYLSDDNVLSNREFDACSFKRWIQSDHAAVQDFEQKSMHEKHEQDRSDPHQDNNTTQEIIPSNTHNLCSSHNIISTSIKTTNH